MDFNGFYRKRNSPHVSRSCAERGVRKLAKQVVNGRNLRSHFEKPKVEGVAARPKPSFP